MRDFKQITPNIFIWSQFSQEKQLDFNGTWIIDGKTSILIDPVVMNESQISEVRKTANPQAILLTNKDHRRAAPLLKETFGNIPIMIHAHDAPLIDCRIDRTFISHDELPENITMIHLPDCKSPGEVAFFVNKNKGSMILGDAIIGKPPEQLSLLPQEKLPNPKAALRSLEKLLDYEFDILILGDGTSILSGAKEKVTSFIRNSSQIK